MSDTKPKKKKKKKKADPFWPIVIILSILAFTGSFWLFYSVTSNINTKTFPTTDSPKWTSPTPGPLSNSGTIMLGDGNQPTPAPKITALPQAQASQIALASSQATPEPSGTPKPTPKPTPESTPKPTSTPTPKPTSTPEPEASEAPVKQIAYRVQVGPFSTKDEAQKSVSKLTENGYQPQLVEDNDKYIVKLGVFEDQEKALSLAEAVIQRRFNVSVRRIER